MLVMRLVLGPSLKVISVMGILLYEKVSPLFNTGVALLLFTVVYKHFDRYIIYAVPSIVV